MNRKTEVLYSDDQMLVVNKPASITVVPDGNNPEAVCLKQILEEEFGRIWVVHRLDRQTSGVLLFARSESAHRFFNDQFAARVVGKVYHALVLGRPNWSEETIEFPLLVGGDRKHRTVVNHQRGKPAITQVKVLERFKIFSLVEARPGSGRRHQIRAHLKAAGIPILVDPLYGDGKELFLSGFKEDYRKSARPERPLLERVALHAFTLTITEPNKAGLKTFYAAYPKDFRAALNALRKFG